MQTFLDHPAFFGTRIQSESQLGNPSPLPLVQFSFKGVYSIVCGGFISRGSLAILLGTKTPAHFYP